MSKVGRLNRSGKFYWDKNLHRVDFSTGDGLCIVHMGSCGGWDFRRHVLPCSPMGDDLGSCGPIELTTIMSPVPTLEILFSQGRNVYLHMTSY